MWWFKILTAGWQEVVRKNVREILATGWSQVVRKNVNVEQENYAKLIGSPNRSAPRAFVKRMSRRNRRRNNKQPKLKNNQIIRSSYTFSAATGLFLTYVPLITNPSNIGNTLTGYVETIGRFSIDCTLEGASNLLNNVALFVMYIPEGYAMEQNSEVVDVVSQHPEWIMAYKYLGSPTDSDVGQGCQPTRITSRVRRNLMTGDRIVLFISGTNSGSAPLNGKIWAYLKFASRIN